MLLDSTRKLGLRDQGGGILLLGALLIPILLMNLAFAVDLVMVMLARQQGQRAVDAAALSAAAGIPHYNSNLSNTNRFQNVLALAQMFNGLGPQPTTNAVFGASPNISMADLTMVFVDNAGNTTLIDDGSGNPTKTKANGVKVSHQYPVPLFFVPYVGVRSLNVTVHATAVVENPSMGLALFPLALFAESLVSASGASGVTTLDDIFSRAACDFTFDVILTPTTTHNGSWYEYEYNTGNNGLSPDSRSCAQRVTGNLGLDLVKVGEDVALNNGNSGLCFGTVVDQCHMYYTSNFDPVSNYKPATDGKTACVATKPWIVTLPVVSYENKDGNKTAVLGFVSVQILGASFPNKNKGIALKILCDEVVFGVPGTRGDANLYLPPTLVE
jgi:Flp pilus assembly protein TadG